MLVSMKRWLPYLLLGASALAPIILWSVTKRPGRSGGLLVVAGCGALAVRDSAMVLGGAPKRLRTLPRVLLWAELVVSALAVAVGLMNRLWGPCWQGEPTIPPKFDRAGRAAGVLAFCLHTGRMVIYVGSPTQGRVRSVARRVNHPASRGPRSVTLGIDLPEQAFLTLGTDGQKPIQ